MCRTHILHIDVEQELNETTKQSCDRHETWLKIIVEN